MGVIDPTIFIDALFFKFSLIENRELNKNRRSYKILNKQDQDNFFLVSETDIQTLSEKSFNYRGEAAIWIRN
jgi:hypothetical protein